MFWQIVGDQLDVQARRERRFREGFSKVLVERDALKAELADGYACHVAYHAKLEDDIGFVITDRDALKARVAELEKRAPPERLWDVQDELAGKKEAPP